MEQKDIIDLILQNLGEVFSVIGLIGGWILKNKEIRKTNKKIGKWKLDCKSEYTFYFLSFNLYKRFVVLFLITQLLKILVDAFCKNIIISWFCCILQIVFNVLITICLCNKTKSKNILLFNKKKKINILIFLNFVFAFVYVVEQFGCGIIFTSILFLVFLAIWIDVLFRNSELISVYEHKYADIYLDNKTKLISIKTESIIKCDDWIIAKTEIDGNCKEYRFKEKDIVQVEYYGDFIIDKHIPQPIFNVDFIIKLFKNKNKKKNSKG